MSMDLQTHELITDLERRVNAIERQIAGKSPPPSYPPKDSLQEYYENKLRGFSAHQEYDIYHHITDIIIQNNPKLAPKDEEIQERVESCIDLGVIMDDLLENEIN